MVAPTTEDETMLKEHNVVSIHKDPRRGYRVRAFIMPADWNALGCTIEETFFRSQNAAKCRARELADTWKAEILGDMG